MKINFNLKKGFKSEFSRNVIVLMTGTTIAQAIPIAITPILTRMYTPEDFGVFALFLAITAITGAIANGHYEQAILLPDEDNDAISIVILSLFVAFFLSVFLFLLVLLFKESFASMLGNKNLANLLYLVPLSTLLMGINNSLNFYNNRKKKYKNISKSLIGRSFSLGFFQLLFGFFSIGSLGLVFGQVLSFFSGNLVLYKTMKEDSSGFQFKKEEIKKQAVIFKKFPIFSLPSIFVNSISLNITNFLITTFFSVGTLGFFSLSQQIIGIPARLIGGGFSQVYFQQASQALKNTGSTERIFLKTFSKLFYITLPIFIILYFVSEPVFAFAFGEKWRIAGTYSKILMPLAFCRFISSCLSNTISIHQKQQYGLLINILLLISTVVVFILGKFLHYDIISSLYLYTIVLSIEYLLFLGLYWKISKNS